MPSLPNEFTVHGVLPEFQYMEVHVKVWGLKFSIESIFGIDELKHGQNLIFGVHISE